MEKCSDRLFTVNEQLG